MEKKHLEKEMNRMKQLNTHLESKLGEQVNAWCKPEGGQPCRTTNVAQTISLSLRTRAL